MFLLTLLAIVIIANVIARSLLVKHILKALCVIAVNPHIQQGLS